MNRSMLHAVAGTTAMLMILAFWVSTFVSELWLDQGAIVAVKHTIAVYGVVAFVLAMAATGGTGFSLGKARSGRLLVGKQRRMPLIALNGLVIMIPSALYLNAKAAAGEFDPLFYAVQALELTVGLVQLALMGMNFRDGLRLAGRLRPRLPQH